MGHDLVPQDPAQLAAYTQTTRDYLDATEDLLQQRAANWSCIGPIDWDHGSVVKSYAAGAAHVYTVEQSAVNTNLIYAGTANSGCCAACRCVPVRAISSSAPSAACAQAYGVVAHDV